MNGNKQQEDMIFFLSDEDTVTYNQKCMTCTHECRQSFKVVIVACPRYEKKEKTNAKT